MGLNGFDSKQVRIKENNTAINGEMQYKLAA
jgi:hypothetical protein